MGTLAFEDLRQLSEVFLSEWSALTVRNEALTPTGPDGAVFVSFWDNWLLPPQPGALEPMIVVDGFALEDGFTIQGGDAVRGKVMFTTSVGGDAIVLATFRRALFRDSFWDANLRQSIQDIANRLLRSANIGPSVQLDEARDPWHIIVMQAGKNALINLQTMLAGLGRTKTDSVEMDMSRAAASLPSAITALKGDIDRSIVAWQWKNSPKPRMVYPVLPGPWRY